MLVDADYIRAIAKKLGILEDVDITTGTVFDVSNVVDLLGHVMTDLLEKANITDLNATQDVITDAVTAVNEQFDFDALVNSPLATFIDENMDPLVVSPLSTWMTNNLPTVINTQITGYIANNMQSLVVTPVTTYVAANMGPLVVTPVNEYLANNIASLISSSLTGVIDSISERLITVLSDSNFISGIFQNIITPLLGVECFKYYLDLNRDAYMDALLGFINGVNGGVL